ncbi:MAG: response regulator, partial [Chlorobiales bacterium]|nr:response regulator [Chlorobiales bacterium]
EREKLREQLLQAQKMESVGRLAGGVAHDFNNMLQAILGYIDIMLSDIQTNELQYERLVEIRRAAQRSADLVRQLLAFARKQTVMPKVLVLNEIVYGMLKMLKPLIGEDIALEWLPGDDLWSVKIDPSQIDQLLTNLVINARDAINGVGKISIETKNEVFDEAYCAAHPDSVPGEYVLLVVSDNGRGIDKDTQAHIFEPFFTTKSIGEGTGLGLATVYGIVKQNGGLIDVESELGKGAIFRIHLPKWTAEAGDAEHAPAVKTIQKGTETLLLVEDEESILNICKAVLEQLGYTVLAANAPSEAIRIANEFKSKIHLLITDVIMPEMNGRELAQRLFEILPDLKCLYMSGYTADIIASRGVPDEQVRFLQKPFYMKDLAAKIREALDEQ